MIVTRWNLPWTFSGPDETIGLAPQKRSVVSGSLGSLPG